MRNIYLLILVLSVTKIQAQNTINIEDMSGTPIEYIGYYIKDTRLDNFLGTWQASMNGGHFIIYLEKVEKQNLKDRFKVDITSDIIQAKYRFQVEGQPTTTWEPDYLIKLGWSESDIVLSFVISDQLTGHHYRGKMQISDNDSEIASFKFNQMERIIIHDSNGAIVPETKGLEIEGGIKSLEEIKFTRVKTN